MAKKKQKVGVIFGIDDFNPGVMFPGSTEELLLQGLFKKFPKLKATCFATAGYSYKQNKYLRHLDKNLSKIIKLNPLNKNNLLSRNQKWAKHFKGIKNIRLELHGFTHYNPKFGTSEEFRGLRKEETLDKMLKSIGEFSKIGIKPKVFCPPGWSLNEHLFEFCKENKIIIAAAFYNQKTKSFSGAKLKSPFKPTLLNGVNCIPRNVDIAKGTTTDVDKAVRSGGIVGFHAHAKNIGVANGLTPENIINFERLLMHLEKTYEPKYCFFSEV